MMDYAPPSLSRYLVTGAKIAISGVLIGIIVSRLDLPVFFGYWHELSPAAIAALLALVAMQTTIIAGARLKLVLECFGRRQPLRSTARVAWCGFFFEQVALGIVGGDAMRLWLLHRVGIPVREAFKALLVDRCIGFAALVFLVALGLPALLEHVSALHQQLSAPLTWTALGAGLAAGLAGLLLIPERYRRHPVFSEIGRMLSISLRDAYVRNRLLLTFSYAGTIHLLNVLIFFLIASNLGLPISLAQWFCIVPAALLFSMIPVSIGGWGLREGIFIFGLGALDVRPEEAAVVSILFGLALLAVTLPGGLVWLSHRKQ